MATPPKTAAQYLAEATGTPAATSKPAPLKAPKAIPFAGGAKAGPQDPLTWLVDILSRPLYAVTDTLKGQIDAPAAAKKVLDNGGSPLAAMGASLQTQLQHNPVTGFFSNDKANKSSTSDLIEHGTDVIGSEVNPNYVDQQNNVNPVLKGILGFAGDVALDPTSYIPGVAIAKGLHLGADAAKAVKGGIGAGVNAVKAARKGEKAIDDIAKDVPITGENAVDSAAATNTADELSAVQPEAPVELTPAQQLSGFKQATEKKAILAVGSPKHVDIKTALASLKPFTREPVLKAVSDPASAPPLGFQDWLKGAQKEIGDRLQHPKLINLPYSKAVGAFPKVAIGGERIPLPTAVGRALAGDTVALEDLGHYYRQGYLSAHAKSAANGKLISPLGKAIEPVSAPVVDAAKLSELQAKADMDLKDVADFQTAIENPAAPSGRKLPDGTSVTNADWIQREVQLANEADGVDTHTPQSVLDWMVGESDKSQQLLDEAQSAANPSASTVLNALQAFKSNARKNEIFVRGALGNDLVDNLQKYTNPAAFDKAVSELSAIMDGSLNITAMKSMAPPSRKLLERLGFTNPETIPAEMKHLQDAAGVTPLPKKDSSYTQKLLAMMDVEDIPQEEIQATAQALEDFTLKNILNPKDPVKYPFTTRVAQAARTADQPGEGVGRILDEANTYAQGDLGNSLMSKVTAIAKQLGAKFGASMASAKSMLHRRMLRLAERALDAQGIPLTIGVGEGRILLSGSQLIDVLHGIDAKAVDTTLYNFNTAVPLTNLYDAAYVAVKGGDRASIESALLNVTSRYGKPMDNNLANPRISENGRYMLGTKILTSEQLTKMLADTIEKATPALQKVVEQNALAHEARGLSETMKMTNDQLAFLEKTFGEETGFGDILTAINDTGTRVLQQADEIGAMQESAIKTGAILNASIPVSDMASAVAATKLQQAADKLDIKMSTAEQLEEMKKVGRLIQLEKYETVTTDVAKNMPGGATLDIGTRISQSINAGILSKMAPVFSRAAGNGLLHDKLVQSESIMRDIMAGVAVRLTRINKQFTPEVKAEAFRTLQKGIVSADPATAAAAREFNTLVGQMFGKANEFSLKDNAFFRENNALFHINAVMEQKGLSDYLFDIEKAAVDAKQSGRSLIDEAAGQWRTHDVKDPVAYINKMYTAMVEVNMHQSIAQEAIVRAQHMGMTSSVPKPGYVRFTNTGGRSVLAAYLPREMYFEENFARQVGVVDTLIRDTLQIGGPIGTFVNQIYRPALDMFKYGMTLINPSHHIRNAISDMDLTRNAEGFTTKPIYKWAMEAVAARNSYDGFDAIAALNGIHVAPKPTRIMFKGKLGAISPDDLYSAMASRGNLPTFKRLENLEEDANPGVLGRSWNTFSNSKVAQKIGSISEARDHWTRLAHAAQFIEKNLNNTSTYKTLDDLYDAASKQVRKWHPDGSDLTNSEQVFRLIIPFYSWQRKAIPLVIETFLTHPARAEVLPKASYNLAVAMGVNPDSLSDPFPTDQMFPTYLTNNMFGPQFKIGGKYYGLNPGFAISDEANTYLGANPLQSILGQVSPYIRAPFELAGGTNVGTGSRINDTSDYIDSNIPVVAPVSRLTGNSVTGSLLSILQGKGFDPQYQIAAGNKDPGTSTATALANYLSGAGITPMSQPNQINYAEIEKRNAAAKAKGN